MQNLKNEQRNIFRITERYAAYLVMYNSLHPIPNKDMYLKFERGP